MLIRALTDLEEASSQLTCWLIAPVVVGANDLGRGRLYGMLSAALVSGLGCVSPVKASPDKWS
jgi:hypothetical protein